MPRTGCLKECVPEPVEDCDAPGDEDGDGYHNYADPDCFSSCLPPNSFVGPIGGSGVGGPYNPPDMFYDGDINTGGGEFAGCCPSEDTNCYTGNPNYADDPCKVDGDVIITGNGNSIVCSVTNNNAVWCLDGYVNDGNGVCVELESCGIGILINNGDKNKLGPNIYEDKAVYIGEDVDDIISHTPQQKQFMMFSATVNNRLLELIDKYSIFIGKAVQKLVQIGYAELRKFY